MSVNSLETKFESLVAEIKDLKSEVRTNSASAMQTEPPFRNFTSDVDFEGNRPTPFMGKRNLYRSPPNQYQEYAYQKPKVVKQFTANPQVVPRSMSCRKCIIQGADVQQIRSVVCIVENLVILGLFVIILGGDSIGIHVRELNVQNQIFPISRQQKEERFIRYPVYLLSRKIWYR